MNTVIVENIDNQVDVKPVNNYMEVSLVPIKTVILSLQASGYMVGNPIEGVELDVNG